MSDFKELGLKAALKRIKRIVENAQSIADCDFYIHGNGPDSAVTIRYEIEEYVIPTEEVMVDEDC